MNALRLLIPKGRIYDGVAELLRDAGFPLRLSERTYRPDLGADWLDAKIMKPQNVGQLLELGSHDAGFTGIDWIKENKADVCLVLDLGFDKVSIVAAVPAGVTVEALKSKRIIAASLKPASLKRTPFKARPSAARIPRCPSPPPS